MVAAVLAERLSSWIDVKVSEVLERILLKHICKFPTLAITLSVQVGSLLTSGSRFDMTWHSSWPQKTEGLGDSTQQPDGRQVLKADLAETNRDKGTKHSKERCLVIKKARGQGGAAHAQLPYPTSARQRQHKNRSSANRAK